MNYQVCRYELNMNDEHSSVTYGAAVPKRAEECRAELDFENIVSYNP
jgi:hypothetical protein